MGIEELYFLDEYEPANPVFPLIRLFNKKYRAEKKASHYL